MPVVKHAMLSPWFSLVTLNLAILWGAQATTLLPMDVQKLARRAQTVIHARVLSVEHAEGQRVARVEILENVRGVEVSSPITIDLLQRGSRAEGWVERVAAAVELKSGEEVLLFLNRARDGQHWVPVGLQQGKYRVIADRRGVRRALSWRDGAINQVSDAELLNSSRTATMISALESGLSGQELERVEPLAQLIGRVQAVTQ